MESSGVLWQARSSQVLNAPTYVVCALFCWLIAPMIYAAWRYLDLRCRTFTLNPETLRIAEGILSQRVDLLEVFRVKDIAIVKPVWLRIFGLGTLHLTTSDQTHPLVHIPAIARVEEIAAILRDLVDKARSAKGVREFDHV